MPLSVVTTVAEEVDVSIDKDASEDVGKEADGVEDYTNKEVLEETSAYMKMGLTYKISPVTLKMQSGLHYQTRQEKG